MCKEMDVNNIKNIVYIIGESEGEPGNTIVHSRVGVTFQEETTPQEQRAFRGRVAPVSKLGDLAAPDESWDLQKMVLRPSLVGSLQWNTTQSTSTIIQSFKIPQDLLTSSLISGPFAKFNFWKGNVKVRVQLNGTPFHVGKLLMFYVPLTSQSVIEKWHVVNFAAATSVPHVFIDAASSTVAELDIPFTNPQGFIRINGDVNPLIDFLGYVYIVVFNPLLVTSGSSASLSMSVWTEMSDVVFKIPNVVSTTLSAIKFGAAEGGEEPIGEAEGAVAEIGSELLGEATTGLVSSLLSTIRRKMLPKNVTGDEFDKKGQSNTSSMDKPADTSDPVRFVRQPLQYMSHNVGVECLDRLALNPSSQSICTFDHFGSTVDEMSIKYLTTLPTFDQTQSWTTGMGDGTNIYNRLVGPNTWTISGPDLSGAVGTNPTFRYNPTLFEYVSMPYAFWRGGIKFRFTITASKFHTGRLWIAMSYGTSTPPSSLAQALNQYGVVIDLQDQQQEWTFVVPYQHVNPWCRMAHGPVAVGEDITDQHLGVLSVWILNSLAVPDAVAPAVYINLFRAGAEDYELCYPSQGNSSFIPINYDPSLGEAEGDAGAGISDTAADMQVQSTNDGIAIAPQRAYASTDLHFRDVSLSIRDDIKRYTPLFPFAAPGPQANYTGGLLNHLNFNTGAWTLSVAPPLHIGEGSFGVLLAKNTFSKGLFGWMSMLYRFWRGSLRYRVLFDLPNGTQRGYVTFDPHYWRTDTATNSRSAITIQDMVLAPYMHDAPTYTANGNTITAAGQLVDATPQSSYLAAMRGSNLAYSVADVNAPYCDVEIPFQTNYNVAITPIETSNVGTLDATQAAGTLLFGTTGIPNTPTAVSWPYAGGSIWMAAGDDFRMGFLLGPPTLTMRGSQNCAGTGTTVTTVSTILPDNYGTYTIPTAVAAPVPGAESFRHRGRPTDGA